MVLEAPINGIVQWATITHDWDADDSPEASTLLQDLVSITLPPIQLVSTDMRDGFFQTSYTTGMQKLPCTFTTQTHRRELEALVGRFRIGEQTITHTARNLILYNDGRFGQVGVQFTGPITGITHAEITQDALAQVTFTIDDCYTVIRCASVAPSATEDPPELVFTDHEAYTDSGFASTVNPTLVYLIDKRNHKWVQGNQDMLWRFRRALGIIGA